MLSEHDFLSEYAHACQKQNRLLNFQQFSIYLDTELNDIKRFFVNETDLKSRFWINLLHNTLPKTEVPNQPALESYMSLLYELLHQLRNHRAFVQIVYRQKSLKTIELKELAAFKKKYLEFIRTIYNRGVLQNEIVNRLLIKNAVVQLFWAQFLFILWYWANDDSNEQQNTDVLVQKAANMLFDFLMRNPIDSTFDFAKFLIKHNKLLNINKIINKLS